MAELVYAIVFLSICTIVWESESPHPFMSLYYKVSVIVEIPSKKESGMDSGCDLDFLLGHAVKNGRCGLVGEANYEEATIEDYLDTFKR